MKRVIEIIMKRDGMNRTDATELVKGVKAQIDIVVSENDGDLSTIEEIEQIIADELGLEPDYVDDFLF